MMENRTLKDVRDPFVDEQKDLLGVAANQDSTTDDHETNNLSSHRINGFDKQQKITVAILGVIAFSIFLLAFFQMRSLVVVPWPTFEGAEQTQTATDVLGDPNDITKLVDKDTDNDGLSDFDELQVYGTSPYLADSDSDGIDDRVEILAGGDPNCPEGEECFHDSVSGDATQDAVKEPAASDALIVPDASVSTLPQPSAAELRQALQSSGKFTADQLAQISDTEILTLYNQLLEENPDLAAQAAAQAPTVVAPTSADDIRQLLLDEGIDAETINALDDATLMQMYQEALNQVKAAQ